MPFHTAIHCCAALAGWASLAVAPTESQSSPLAEVQSVVLRLRCHRIAVPIARPLFAGRVDDRMVSECSAVQCSAAPRELLSSHLISLRCRTAISPPVGVTPHTTSSPVVRRVNTIARTRTPLAIECTHSGRQQRDRRKRAKPTGSIHTMQTAAKVRRERVEARLLSALGVAVRRLRDLHVLSDR